MCHSLIEDHRQLVACLDLRSLSLECSQVRLGGIVLVDLRLDIIVDRHHILQSDVSHFRLASGADGHSS